MPSVEFVMGNMPSSGMDFQFEFGHFNDAQVANHELNTNNYVAQDNTPITNSDRSHQSHPQHAVPLLDQVPVYFI